MAENKKSFIAYCEWQETFKELSNENAGKLVKHLFNYVNDENPKSEDELVKMCFIPIKQSLKRDLKKYEDYIEKQRLNGLKGGRPRKTQITQPFIKKPKKADIVNVNVIDNDIIHIEQAYDFLKNKNPIEIEAFEMQNRKSFPDWDKFITHYNYKVILDEIDWEIPKLMAKLMLVNNNWDKSPKGKTPPTAEENLEEALKINK